MPCSTIAWNSAGGTPAAAAAEAKFAAMSEVSGIAWERRQTTRRRPVHLERQGARERLTAAQAGAARRSGGRASGRNGRQRHDHAGAPALMRRAAAVAVTKFARV